MACGFLDGFADGLEVLGNEVALDVCVGDIATQRGQAVIQWQLIKRIDRGRQAAVVAGRQDVVGAVLRRRDQ